MSQASKDVHEAINKKYHKQMTDPLLAEFYGSSGFHNLGYWYPDTADQETASRNLVDKLLEQIPDKHGKILDVACGNGATTRELLKLYPPGAITGINISEEQLERARAAAPGVDFQLMDATRMKFPDQSFDNIICVEAAFHFDTRAMFLAEAYRLLRPGGRLVVSDVLKKPGQKMGARRNPPANAVAGVDEYEAVWQKAGFVDLYMADCTEECAGSFRRALVQFAGQKLRDGAIDKERFGKIALAAKLSGKAGNLYVLAAGTRQPEADTS